MVNNTKAIHLLCVLITLSILTIDIFASDREIQVTALSSDSCKLAAKLAELSAYIYRCNKPKCTIQPPAPWILIDESRAGYQYLVTNAKSSTSESTPPVSDPSLLPKCTGNDIGACQEQITITINDPIGFHAIAVKNTQTNQYAIIYEGTDFTSLKDWLANISHVVTVPMQYISAREFAGHVIKNVCGNNNTCSQNVIVGGHSLGGGLAHYAALYYGLKAYIYNPAALWGPTASDLDTSLATKSEVTIFQSSSARSIGINRTDIVTNIGDQYGATIVEVPEDLPGYGVLVTDVLSDYLSLHSIENLQNWLSASCVKPANIVLNDTSELKSAKCNTINRVLPGISNLPPCPFFDKDPYIGECFTLPRKGKTTGRLALYADANSTIQVGVVGPGVSITLIKSQLSVIPCPMLVDQSKTGYLKNGIPQSTNINAGEIIYLIRNIGEGASYYWRNGQIIQAPDSICAKTQYRDLNCWAKPLMSCPRDEFNALADTVRWFYLETADKKIKGWTVLNNSIVIDEAC